MDFSAGLNYGIHLPILEMTYRDYGMFDFNGDDQDYELTIEQKHLYNASHGDLPQNHTRFYSKTDILTKIRNLDWWPKSVENDTDFQQALSENRSISFIMSAFCSSVSPLYISKEFVAKESVFEIALLIKQADLVLDLLMLSSNNFDITGCSMSGAQFLDEEGVRRRNEIRRIFMETVE